MPHPVANHPQLSSAYPDLAENTLMSAIAMITLSQTSGISAAVKSSTIDKLENNGLSTDLASRFAEATQKAAESNAVALSGMASELGMSPGALCMILTRANKLTLDSISNALAAKGL